MKTAVLTSLFYACFMIAQAQTTNIYPASGAVGIGTTAPSSARKLHIYSTTNTNDVLIQSASSAGQAAIEFMPSGTGYIMGATGSGNTTIANSFYLYNLSTGSFPLIVKNNNIGIGTLDTKGYKLAVAGNMIAEKVVVKLQGNWPDYVFDSTYDLKPLDQLENYISQNKHLPEIETAADMQKDGLDLGAIQTKLLQKIEELTLYMIEQNKQIETLKKEIIQLRESSKK